MIKYNEMYSENNNEAFATIEKPGVYHGRLIGIRISEQDPKFVEEGKEPKKQVSFLWDVLNKEKLSCHTATKPCTISFTDRSKLPIIFENVSKLTKLDDYLKLLYNGSAVKDIYASLLIKVTEKDGKFFSEVEKVVEFEDTTAQKTSTVTEWDKKVYGKECIDIDFNPKYLGDEVADDDDDLFKRLNEK